MDIHELIARQNAALRRESQRAAAERRRREAESLRGLQDAHAAQARALQHFSSADAARVREQAREAAERDAQHVAATGERTSIIRDVAATLRRADQERERLRLQRQRTKEERRAAYDAACTFAGHRFGSPTECLFYQAWIKVYPAIPLEFAPHPGYRIPESKYYGDFVHLASRTIIEIDGERHRRTVVQGHDYEREDALQNRGWRVVRVTGTQVVQAIGLHLPRVYEAIQQQLERQNYGNQNNRQDPGTSQGGDPPAREPLS